MMMLRPSRREANDVSEGSVEVIEREGEGLSKWLSLLLYY